MTKMYYTTDSSPTFNVTTQIIPTPQIAVSTDIDYASDNNNILVGHKHTITLTGTATAYRKTDTDPNNQALVLRNVSENINQIRKLLSQMGYCLYIRDDNRDILVAKGGKLISFNITESDNNWKSFANYTAQIEFQSLDYIGDDYSCEFNIFNIAYPSGVGRSSITTDAVDISKYKIKEYNENYEIAIVDGLYNRIRKIDTDNDLKIENLFINFTYNISAVGKHFFIDEKLLPAWEQAKNFVQDKLYTKINNLGSVLGITSAEACGAADDITQIQSVPFSGSGLLANIYPEYYSIFNEEISCETSESDGSFSAIYKCILKRNIDDKYTNNSIHTFNKKIDYQRLDKKNTSISIDGNIQGLIPGGLILMNNSGFFELPNQGNLIIVGAKTSNSKYDNALATLNLILDIDGKDLSTQFKDDIGITPTGLDIINIPQCTEPLPIKASSLNLTHNPFDGTITYSINYDSNLNFDIELSSVSISVNKSIPIFATFEIPGAAGTSNVGTVLQDIGTQTSKRIDITIQGINTNNKICGLTPDTINSIYNNICNEMILPVSIQDKLPDPDKFILTTKNKTTNLNDGSYIITLGYICNSGCII